MKNLGTMSANVIRMGFAAALVGALTGCAVQEIAPALRPLPKDTVMLLGRMGMTTEAPIFVRIFKEESELEVWKARADGHFYHFKTYPICNWSGELGPKVVQGDKQAPEGFYTVSKGMMNPNSGFHLAFNLGYPNIYDRAHRRTGDFLMVHGKCRSAGCYAMTDALIEEIYGLAREAFAGGQESFQVHAFPFRMSAENLARHRGNRWYPFWMTLKDGYDHFETTRKVPQIAVCERRYHVNVRPLTPARIDPEGRCPTFERPKLEAFRPMPIPGSKVAEIPPVIVPGPKMRSMASAPADAGGVLSGLTKSPSLGLTGGQ